MNNSPLLAPQTRDTALAHGLSADEFAHLNRILSRPPNLVELGIVSAMWSEHCSYKSSRHLLATLPTTADAVLQGPGENAGAVDIGDGQAAVFKMESHNHPSFIEPHQGAATGVGGILRDIFTMGARPVAILNALRFGAPDHEKTPALLAGVVSGISSYGNCVGVPTVGGETNFHPGYNTNILVNVMAVGVAERLFYARGAQPGLPVMYVGARTGRDGIHGASMSSSEFASETEANRPTVQVGDPFMEKMLIEACLELMATDVIVAIQDMGAAGLTSSAVEMAAKAGAGIEMDLDAVPLREPSMTPYEIMLSESQERMLMVVHPGQEDEARAVFAKWELAAETIGRITSDGRLRLTHCGRSVCDLPIGALAEPPRPTPPAIRSASPRIGARTGDMSDVDACAVLVALMASADMCSKRWIWQQYDRHVMGDTIELAGVCADAAIVRVHGTAKALALTSDCTPRYVAADARLGAMQAVAEAYRNLCAVGARPLAITNNLNFGAPSHAEVAADLAAAVAGLAEAARVLSFPVVSGNVSLNNETDGRAIPPTPVIGGLGLIANIAVLAGLGAPRAGDRLVVLGETAGHMHQTLYRAVMGLGADGLPPPVDLSAEKTNAHTVRSAIADALVRAVHDVSDGGIACAAAEMALAAGIGVSLCAPPRTCEHSFFFAEDQGRYLLAVPDDNMAAARALAPEAAWTVIGQFGGDGVCLGDSSIALSALREAHEATLPDIVAGGGQLCGHSCITQ